MQRYLETYFYYVLKTLLDKKLDFFQQIWKKVLDLQKLINAQYQIKTHRPDSLLKKNK